MKNINKFVLLIAGIAFLFGLGKILNVDIKYLKETAVSRAIFFALILIFINND